ncbi:MAG: class II aldolase/adducin family protein [Caulobacteraceae bacterium]|nr:class II aldolase/adducin family protein [Caulobacteraceae bacterium]
MSLASVSIAHDQPGLAPLRRLPPKALPTVQGEGGQPRPPQPTIELERLYRKQRLAAAFRLFGRFGFDFGGAGHITVRDPEFPDQFWLNPAGVHFGHIRVSDLMLVNHDGEIVEHGEVASLNRAAFAIHSRLHKARPDVHAAAHSHSIYGKAFSALGKLLDPLSQDSCAFYEDHALFEHFSGVVLDTEEGDRIAEVLGPGKAVILQNHGILTVGPSVETAVWRYIAMENACQAQLLAEAAGQTKPVPHAVAKHTAAQVGGPFGDYGFQPYFDLIAREEPDLFD